MQRRGARPVRWGFLVELAERGKGIGWPFCVWVRGYGMRGETGLGRLGRRAVWVGFGRWDGASREIKVGGHVGWRERAGQRPGSSHEEYVWRKRQWPRFR